MLNKYLFIMTTIFLLTIGSAVNGFGDSRGGHGNGNGGNKHEQIPLSEDEIEGLLFMREEEKLARDSYLMMDERWGLAIFENIANSEQTHMDAMKTLIDKYGLTDPVIPGVGEFNNKELQKLYDELIEWGSQSLMNGLNVGTLIEETDLIDIQHATELAEHEVIISTYESLMCGSRNHLRAFVRQVEANGEVYDPSDEYFEKSDQFFLEVASSPMERGCGRKN